MPLFGVALFGVTTVLQARKSTLDIVCDTLNSVDTQLFSGLFYVRQGARIFGCIAGAWALFGGFSLMVVGVWNYILAGILRR